MAVQLISDSTPVYNSQVLEGSLTLPEDYAEAEDVS